MHIRSVIYGTVAVAALGVGWSSAFAAPVYIGLQEFGVNGGAITQEFTGSGTASVTNLGYGTFFLSSVTAQGTPPLNEPDLDSTAVALTSTTLGAGVINVYISELNQFPVNFNSFESIFGTSVLGQIGGSITSVTEKTYVTPCTTPGQPCGNGNIFALGNLLSQTTFTATGSVTDFAGIPADINALTVPYSTTLLYTFTAVGGSYGDATSSIDLQSSTLTGGNQGEAPLPATLPLFASGLGVMGFLAKRRKRKDAAAMAAV